MLLRVLFRPKLPISAYLRSGLFSTIMLPYRFEVFFTHLLAPLQQTETPMWVGHCLKLLELNRLPLVAILVNHRTITFF